MIVSRTLSDTHVLIVEDDDDTRKMLVTLFRELGAEVHHAATEMQGTGLFFRLYKQRCIPRVVITSWWLCAPGSQKREFAEKYLADELERSITCVPFLENVFDLDPDAFVAVYTDKIAEPQQTLVNRGWNAPIFDCNKITPADFVTAIATHDGIARQRPATEVVRNRLRNVAGQVESGVYHALRTPLPG